MLNNSREYVIYASVLADGLIHVEVPKETEGAKVREYETSDGKTGTRYENVYTEIVGTITKIAFYYGNFGTTLQLTITDGDEKPVVLALGTSSNYGEDMMKKLPNVDLSMPVKLAPYAFEDNKGKSRKGITVTQNGVKILNHFYDVESKELLHNHPKPPVAKKNKTISSDEWKVYFGQVRLFLIGFITEKYDLDSEQSITDF